MIPSDLLVVRNGGVRYVSITQATALLIVGVLLPYAVWRLRVPQQYTQLTTSWIQHTVHTWSSFTYAPQPRYCSYCRELISGFLLFSNIGYECIICGIFAHISCIRGEQQQQQLIYRFVGSERTACKNPARDSPVKHQIRIGNLQNNSVCSFCGVVCSSSFSLFGLECLWCHRTYHSACLDQALEIGHEAAVYCDLGQLAELILPPSSLTLKEVRRAGVLPFGVLAGGTHKTITTTPTMINKNRRSRSISAISTNPKVSVRKRCHSQPHKQSAIPQRGSVSSETMTSKNCQAEQSSSSSNRVSARDPERWTLRGVFSGPTDNVAAWVNLINKGFAMTISNAFKSSPEDAPEPILAQNGEMPFTIIETTRGKITEKLSYIAKSFARGKSGREIHTTQPNLHDFQKNLCKAILDLFKLVVELTFDLERYNSSPLLVFVNTKSGGQLGQSILKEFYAVLNPWQVVNVTSDGDPRVALARWRPLVITGRMRILVCGGDGTVSRIVDAVEEEYKLTPSQLCLADWAKVCQRWEMRPFDSDQQLDCTVLLDDLALIRRDSPGCPIAILPLGTGNDLGRVLNWGATFDAGELTSFLRRLVFAKPVQLDLWEIEAVKHVMVNEPTVSSRSTFRRLHRASATGDSPVAGGVIDQTQVLLFKKTFTNYVDFGIAARIALKFHVLREAHPELFRSRLGNKFLYGEVGVRDFLVDQPVDLLTTEIYCDGEPVDLEHLRFEGGVEGLAVVNIPSFAGGCDLWKSEECCSFSENGSPHLSPRYHSANSNGGTPPRRSILKVLDMALNSHEPVTKPGKTRRSLMSPQRYSDQLIELVAFKSLLHLGQVQVGLAHAVKLAQGKEIRLILQTTVPIQIDGEPLQLGPCEIKISWKSSTTMLHFQSPSSRIRQTYNERDIISSSRPSNANLLRPILSLDRFTQVR